MISDAKAGIQGGLSLWPFMVRAVKLVWKAAPGWTVIWLLLLVIQGLLPVATVYLTKYLVDSLVAVIDGGLSSAAVRPAVMSVLGMLLIQLIATILGSFTNTVLTTQSELISDYMRNMVHAKALQLDLAFYDSADYYDRLFRARYEGAQQPLTLVRAFGSLLQDGITLVAMAGVLLQYGLILPVALIVSSIPAFVAVLHNRLITYRWRMRVTSDERRSWYYDWLLTDRSTAAEMRLFDLGDHYRNAFQVIRARLRDEQISISKRQGFVEFLASVFSLFVMALALAWMVWQAILGFVTLGDLALFYQAFNTGQRLARSLLQNVGEIYASSMFLEDLFEFLDLQPGVTDPQQPLPSPTQPQLGVAFEQVQFQYPGSQRELLSDFNLTINPGSFVALVGKNGAGKSTLVKLLTRLYDVDNGRITVGGVDIRQMRQKDLQRLITVLFQEPVQYNETVAQNISLGDLPNADEDKIIRAAQQAGTDSFIRTLPDQYATLLGKWFVGGTELSVGEWQRIALARAFLREASIVILDEPTSAMDPWAEAQWLQDFRQYTAEHTVLLVTHRFSSARYADQILVMDGGQIVESGTHEELTSQGGLYAASWHASQRQKGTQ